MPAHRQPKIDLDEVIWEDEADARHGGLGLAFDKIPKELDRTGRAEWRRLAEVFADEPARFREADRTMLAAYCTLWSIFRAATDDLLAHGLTAEGRSDKDRGRVVRSPAMTTLNQVSTQLRQYATALGLTPQARRQMGIREEVAVDDDNPFK